MDRETDLSFVKESRVSNAPDGANAPGNKQVHRKEQTRNLLGPVIAANLKATGLGNIALPCRRIGLSKSSIHSTISNILSLCGADEFINPPIPTCAAGTIRSPLLVPK